MLVEVRVFSDFVCRTAGDYSFSDVFSTFCHERCYLWRLQIQGAAFYRN